MGGRLAEAVGQDVQARLQIRVGILLAGRAVPAPGRRPRQGHMMRGQRRAESQARLRYPVPGRYQCPGEARGHRPVVRLAGQPVCRGVRVDPGPPGGQLQAAESGPRLPGSGRV